MNFQTLVEGLLLNFQKVLATLVNSLPHIFFAAIFIWTGYYISKICQRIFNRFFAVIGLNRFAQSTGIFEALQRFGIQQNFSQILAWIGFWLIFLLFIISGVSYLEITIVGKIVDRLIDFTPNLLSAMAVFIVGAILAKFLRDLIQHSTGTLKIGYSNFVGNGAYALSLVAAFTIAIAQLKIEINLLYHIIDITLVTLGLTLAIAVGLGARDLIQQAIAARYAKDSLTHGSRIKWLEHEGVLQSISPLNLVIEKDDGTLVYIPSHHFGKDPIIVVKPTAKGA